MDTLVKISKEQFEDLHGKELGWQLIEPTIRLVRGQNLQIKKEVYDKLTPGQKSLFSFWVLHGHTQSGWLQFFMEGYSPYLPLIKWGLQKIDDQMMLANLHAAEIFFAENSEFLKLALSSPEKSGNPHQKDQTDWDTIRRKFAPLDRSLWTLLDETIRKLEAYIRAYPDEFVIFTA